MSDKHFNNLMCTNVECAMPEQLADYVYLHLYYEERNLQNHERTGSQHHSKSQSKPFRKPNDFPVYVHAQSNHASSHIKNIPINVEKRLNMLSCNEEVFNEAKPMYQIALRNSGYDYELNMKK